MFRIRIYGFSLALSLVLVAGCSPSESAIQTAIAETERAQPEIPTLSPYPTQTPYPTYTPFPSSNPRPRTYYETLDLSSPESAIHTFVEAFSRDDFPTVWLVFEPSTQFMWYIRLTTFEYDALIKTDNWDEISMDISTFAKGLGEGEHSEADTGYLFDQFMLAARKHSAFIIDLTGSVQILSSEPSITRQDDPAIDVTVRIEKTEHEVTFRMVQSLSRRWRVYKVFVPGTEDGSPPWGIPLEDE